MSATGAHLLLNRAADGGVVQVVALYEAPADPPGHLRYELEVLREGQAGRSSSRQSGSRKAVHPGRTDTLCVSQVNVSIGDRLQVHLRLYADHRLVDEVRRDTVVSTPD